MAWLLRGWPIEEGQALFDRLTDKLIVPNLRREALDRLRDHQAKGHLVGLVSGTFAPWLATVASRLEVPHAIGTPLETREGRYTGRIIPPLCNGHDKLMRVQQYAGGQGIEIDWTASYAYGDRVSDVPLLAQVGHPVAVSPEPDLLAHAQASGWPVL
jgi:HAD superfamily hydrolase (TIGR01490 family)